MRPVSYTHLDVYKRQKYSSGWGTLFAKGIRQTAEEGFRKNSKQTAPRGRGRRHKENEHASSGTLWDKSLLYKKYMGYGENAYTLEL